MHRLANIIEIQMDNEGFKASVRCWDVGPNRWATLGRCEGVGGGEGRSFKGSQSVPATIFGQWGVAGGRCVVITALQP